MTKIELCSKFYNLDDSSAPALVLVAEHLNDFIREAKRVQIAASRRPPAV